jgi:hypothetical protein
MSTIPLISHRLYVAAVRPGAEPSQPFEAAAAVEAEADTRSNFGRPVSRDTGPLTSGEGESQPALEQTSVVSDSPHLDFTRPLPRGEGQERGRRFQMNFVQESRRDADTIAVPVKVSGDWKIRARRDEAVNSAAEAPKSPLEILESRRPMPSGARRSQSTVRATT